MIIGSSAVTNQVTTDAFKINFFTPFFFVVCLAVYLLVLIPTSAMHVWFVLIVEPSPEICSGVSVEQRLGREGEGRGACSDRRGTLDRGAIK